MMPKDSPCPPSHFVLRFLASFSVFPSFKIICFALDINRSLCFQVFLPFPADFSLVRFTRAQYCFLKPSSVVSSAGHLLRPAVLFFHAYDRYFLFTACLPGVATHVTMVVRVYALGRYTAALDSLLP